MADITPNANRINDEEVRAKAPVTELLLSRMGGSINAALAVILPVGSYIPCDLTEFQFQTEIGSTDTWILADGRDVTGSRYHAVTGKTHVPDMRGLGLRVKNNGRSDGKQDPDGERELGSYQGDLVGEHFHYGPGVSSGASGPVFPGHGVPTVETEKTFAGRVAGGAETRMRNGATNLMIRIN